MDQYQCRGKLLKNFEDHWSIRISPGKGMDQWLVHTNFPRNRYGAMALVSKFSESFSLDRYWSIECSSLEDQFLGISSLAPNSALAAVWLQHPQWSATERRHCRTSTGILTPPVPPWQEGRLPSQGLSVNLTFVRGKTCQWNPKYGCKGTVTTRFGLKNYQYQYWRAETTRTFSTSIGNHFWEISGISRKIITSAGVYWYCTPHASAPVVVTNESPTHSSRCLAVLVWQYFEEAFCARKVRLKWYGFKGFPSHGSHCSGGPFSTVFRDQPKEFPQQPKPRKSQK